MKTSATVVTSLADVGPATAELDRQGFYVVRQDVLPSGSVRLSALRKADLVPEVAAPVSDSLPMVSERNNDAPVGI